MSNPKVTVLIPCYNVEAYIEKALENVLAQTYTNLEILLIDDGSTDATLSLISRLAERDPRVVVVVNEYNLGLIKTLNKGLTLAKGEYIERFDADDIIRTDRIRQQVEYIKRDPSCQLITSRAVYITADGHFHSKVNLFYGTTTLVAKFISMFECPLLHAGMFISTDLLKRYGYSETDDAQHSEDYDLFSRLLADDIKIHVQTNSQSVYFYRRNPSSVSTRNREKQDENVVRISARNLKRTCNVELHKDVHRLLLLRNKKYVASTFRMAVTQLKEVEELFIRMNGNQLKDNEIRQIKNWTSQRILSIMMQSIIYGDMRTRVNVVPVFLMNSEVLLMPRTYSLMFNRFRWIISRIRFK